MGFPGSGEELLIGRLIINGWTPFFAGLFEDRGVTGDAGGADESAFKVGVFRFDDGLSTAHSSGQEQHGARIMPARVLEEVLATHTLVSTAMPRGAHL